MSNNDSLKEDFISYMINEKFYHEKSIENLLTNSDSLSYKDKLDRMMHHLNQISNISLSLKIVNDYISQENKKQE